jgi:hypothetical protein
LLASAFTREIVSNLLGTEKFVSFVFWFCFIFFFGAHYEAKEGRTGTPSAASKKGSSVGERIGVEGLDSAAVGVGAARVDGGEAGRGSGPTS